MLRRDVIFGEAVAALYKLNHNEKTQPEDRKTLVDYYGESAQDPVRSMVTQRALLMCLQALNPGLTLVDVICVDLKPYEDWKLPVTPVRSLKKDLTQACINVESQTGFKGPLKAYTVLEGKSVKGLNTAVDQCLMTKELDYFKPIKDDFVASRFVFRDIYKTPVSARKDMRFPALERIREIADTDAKKKLRPDIQMTVLAARVMDRVYKAGVGLRSENAKIKKLTLEKYPATNLSGVFSQMMSAKQAAERQHRATKLAAMAKRQPKAKAKAMAVNVTARIEIKSVYSEHALEILESAKSFVVCFSQYCLLPELVTEGKGCKDVQDFNRKTVAKSKMFIGETGMRIQNYVIGVIQNYADDEDHEKRNQELDGLMAKADSLVNNRVAATVEDEMELDLITAGEQAGEGGSDDEVDEFADQDGQDWEGGIEAWCDDMVQGNEDSDEESEG
eukprot:g8045.t1